MGLVVVALLDIVVADLVHKGLAQLGFHALLTF